MPERQILLFVLTKHLSRSRTGDHLHLEYTRILVHPSPLEDQYEKDVCGDECGDGDDSALGYDWYLDNKVWVR